MGPNINLPPRGFLGGSGGAEQGRAANCVPGGALCLLPCSWAFLACSGGWGRESLLGMLDPTPTSPGCPGADLTLWGRSYWPSRSRPSPGGGLKPRPLPLLPTPRSSALAPEEPVLPQHTAMPPSSLALAPWDCTGQTGTGDQEGDVSTGDSTGAQGGRGGCPRGSPTPASPQLGYWHSHFHSLPRL